MNLKPGDVAALLSIKEPTLRKWSGDFGQYLSPTGAGGDGRKRAYSEQDVQIMLLIRDWKAGNTGDEEIHVSLKSLQASGWRGLPELPAAPPGMDPIAVIPTEAAEVRLKERERTWELKIQQIQTELDKVLEQLSASNTDRQRLEMDKTRLEKELAIANAARANAEGKLSERFATRTWLLIVAGVVIVAIIATVLLTRGL